MWCLGTCFSGGLDSVNIQLDSMILKVFSNLNDSMIINSCEIITGANP